MSHTFFPAGPRDSRSPCPALNALANQGYLPRSGRDISFSQLMHALQHVYNLSLPLSLLLTLSGLLSCGHYRFRGITPHLVLDLDALASCGQIKIAHDASLVHANAPARGAPKSKSIPITVSKPLLNDLLSHADAKRDRGLDMCDFARVRISREAQLRRPLDDLHKQISQGEASLAWLTMRDPDGDVPAERLRQWFGEERLPDGWWSGVRPQREVGLLEARRRASDVDRAMRKLNVVGAGTC